MRSKQVGEKGKKERRCEKSMLNDANTRNKVTWK